MPKKIIDLVSRPQSQVSGNVAVRLVKSSQSPPTSKKTVKTKPRKKKRAWGIKMPSFNSTWVFAGLVLVLILAIAMIVMSMKAKATIAVFPVLSDIDLQEEFEVKTSQEQIDAENKILPGKLLETTEEKWGTFKSTGSDQSGGKAEGIILIYNSQNPPRAFNFVAQTRFVSSKEGKTFKAQEKVYLPPATLSSGKITPSMAQVKVQAQEPGDVYNIGPSKFSVPGLSGTAFYYNVWGESKTAMRGGSSSDVKIVTKDDIEAAQENLRALLETQSKDGLQRTLPDGFAAERDSASFDNFESSCFQKEGDQAVDFNCYGKMEATSIGYKISDFDFLVKDILERSVGQKKRYYVKDINARVFSKSALSKSGSAILGLGIKARVFDLISEQAVASVAKGEKKREVEGIIKEKYPQIMKIEIKLWPFWIGRIPKDLSKIKVFLAGENH